MQTFLPFADFAQSAAVLDDSRLGKQRVEAYQVLRTLDGITSGWRHHPVVKMWRGYEAALYEYTLRICDEWDRRGHADTVRSKLAPHARPADGLPTWLGDPALHASHRSNLLRKDPEWYGRFGWTEPPDLPYVWPDSDRAPSPSHRSAGSGR